MIVKLSSTLDSLQSVLILHPLTILNHAPLAQEAFRLFVVDIAAVNATLTSAENAVKPVFPPSTTI